jgi:hypothetical protein
MMPIAHFLREADDRFGLPRECPVPGCTTLPVVCCPRPPHLPAGTRWPTAPEVCATHGRVRLEVLVERARQQRPNHGGPIHGACMPMPSVAALAPTPEELAGFDVS